MAQKTPILEGLGIVLVGSMNPAIFQPWWFAKYGLIGDGEAGAAKIDVVHPDLTKVDFEGYSLLVTDDKFQLTTLEQPYYPVIRDLVLGTFRLLSHTPIRFMGLNLEAHYPVDSELVWHRFGDLLAPKEPWGQTLKAPGLRTLTMEGVRPDESKGCLRVTVQPSTHHHPGVFFKVNDHFEFEPETRAGAVASRLEQVWAESFVRSREIIQGLLEQIK